jgi:hypothetical protein
VILDRWGQPATTCERSALGFVERTLPDADSETLTGLSAHGTLYHVDETHEPMECRTHVPQSVNPGSTPIRN